MKRATCWLAVAMAAACAEACGSSRDSQFTDKDGDKAGNGTTAGDGGGSLGDDITFGSDAGGGNGLALRVEPATVTVRATGSLSSVSGSVQFRAFVSNSSTPVDAKWSLDNASVGGVGADGTFTAVAVAGKTKVYAQVGNLQATAEVTVQLELVEDLTASLPANQQLSDGEKAKLRTGTDANAGGQVPDSLFKWRYPYDATVFPRGLPAPTLQFAGGVAKGAYVKVTCNDVSYEGFYPGWSAATGAAGAPRVKVSEEWWRMVTRSAGPGDKVEVLVRKIDASGVVSEAGKETWTIAQGNLKGTILYNSYNSKLAGGGTNPTGAILRLKPGTPLSVFASQAKVTKSGSTTSGCIVCHSVSANGKRVVGGVNWDDGADNQDGNPVYGGSWAVNDSGGAVQERDLDPEGRALPFGALTPDGKWLLGQGNPSTDWSPVRGIRRKFRSRVYNADTGATVSETYFGGATERFVLTPSFSPDGRWLAFSNYDSGTVPPDEYRNGRTLTLLPVTMNGGGSSPTFGTPVKLYNAPADRLAGWPTFTPDGNAVLFHQGDSLDTSANAEKSDPQLGAHYAELHWVDVATKQVKRLDALNGRSAGTCQLKDGDGAGTADCDLNYEPTVLPAAVGGYFWVVFTSRRAFGNTIYQGKHSLSSGGDHPFDNPDYEVDGKPLNKGYRKKLWVAAVDINGQPGQDISHPAFYLEGQEAEAGNMRGFWALDPCKTEASGCETGDECCGGFCRQVTDASGNSVKQCVPPPSGCSNESEKCGVDADCCDATGGTRCVGGYCALPTPVK